MAIYGYCGISQKKQNIERQVRNITNAYPTAVILREAYTGRKIEGRKEWEKLYRTVRTGDMIVLRGWVTYVGHSSMEDRVDTYREALDGKREMINRAYIDMVCIDCKGHPQEVPGLCIETDAQRQEYEAAQKRKQVRKQRRQEGF